MKFVVIFKLSRANFKKFNLYVVTKITQLVFCGLYMHILFLPEQWKCWTKLIYLFLFCLLIKVHSGSTLPLVYKWIKKDWQERKKIRFALSAFKASSGSMQSVTAWGCQHPCLLSPRHKHTYFMLPLSALNSHTLWSMEFRVLRMLCEFCVLRRPSVNLCSEKAICKLCSRNAVLWMGQ